MSVPVNGIITSALNVWDPAMGDSAFCASVPLTGEQPVNLAGSVDSLALSSGAIIGAAVGAVAGGAVAAGVALPVVEGVNGPAPAPQPAGDFEDILDAYLRGLATDQQEQMGGNPAPASGAAEPAPLAQPDFENEIHILSAGIAMDPQNLTLDKLKAMKAAAGCLILPDLVAGGVGAIEGAQGFSSGGIQEDAQEIAKQAASSQGGDTGTIQFSDSSVADDGASAPVGNSPPADVASAPATGTSQAPASGPDFAFLMNKMLEWIKGFQEDTLLKLIQNNGTSPSNTAGGSAPIVDGAMGAVDGVNQTLQSPSIDQSTYALSLQQQRLNEFRSMQAQILQSYHDIAKQSIDNIR